MPPSFASYIAPARPGAALWRTGLGLVLIMVLYLALNLGAALVYTWVTDTRLSSGTAGQTPLSVLIMLGSFLPLIFAVVVVVRVVHHRDGWTLMGAHWGLDFLRAALLLILLHSAGLWLWHLGGGSTRANLDPTTWLLLLPLAIGATLIQTLAEELLFRGYLLQQLAARFVARWVWFALPALVFGFAHSQPTLFGEAWIYPVLAATVFGLIGADLTVRRGNIGMAWGLHFATNLFALTVVAAGPVMTGLALRSAPHQITELADRPWLLVGDLVPLLIAWTILRRTRGG